MQTICTSLQTDNHTNSPTPHCLIFIGRMLFLTPNQWWQSTEGCNTILVNNNRTCHWLLLDHIACAVLSVGCRLLLQTFVCCAHGWALQKRMNRSICCLRADLVRPKEPCIRWGRGLTLAQPGEYSWSVYAAAMRACAIITVATCLF